MTVMKILVAFGTRPEAIKMAPVVHALKGQKGIEVVVCVTAQHREMLDQVLTVFDIIPDHDLDLMRPDQSLYEITARILTGMESVIQKECPEWILVHGDTTTAFACAAAGFYAKVKVGHVEAGLRTGDLYSPWPEEANRRLVGVLAQMHFAPTEQARANLRAEGVPEDKILVTGNTVVDALLWCRTQILRDESKRRDLMEKFSFLDMGSDRVVLVTGHRRENFGPGIQALCQALSELARQHPDVHFVYPVHLNPNVSAPVNALLAGVPNIHLLPPQGYEEFVYLMDIAAFIITDSGGIQEEAPALNKPVLVTREVTERPEAVECGAVRLVGSQADRLVAAATQLLKDEDEYRLMTGKASPYGTGVASVVIADFLLKESNEREK